MRRGFPLVRVSNNNNNNKTPGIMIKSSKKKWFFEGKISIIIVDIQLYFCPHWNKNLINEWKAILKMLKL